LEKRVAHYDLQMIRALIEDERYVVTLSARQSYAALGLCDDEVLEIIHTLKAKHLYKSMTSYHDTTVWQDVYHQDYRGIKLYIKLQVREDAIIISFKERT